MVARSKSEQMAQRQADFGMSSHCPDGAGGGAKGFADLHRAIRYGPLGFFARSVRRPPAAAALPALEDRGLRFLGAPFWMSDTTIRLDYLGVEIDAETGDAYDKVKVFGQTPGTPWSIAYFSRRTSFLTRFLALRNEGELPPSF